jgi:hypothetical protein
VQNFNKTRGFIQAPRIGKWEAHIRFLNFLIKFNPDLMIVSKIINVFVKLCIWNIWALLLSILSMNSLNSRLGLGFKIELGLIQLN